MEKSRVTCFHFDRSPYWSNPCSVCILKVNSVLFIVTVIGLYVTSAFLTNRFPYRDWLNTLGIVVLVLQRSVLVHWGMPCVRLLKTHTSGNIIQSVCFAMCRTTWRNCVDDDTDDRHLSTVTHPVSRAVGLLRGRGLVLGWTPEMQNTHSCLVSHKNVTCCVAFHLMDQICHRTNTQTRKSKHNSESEVK